MNAIRRVLLSASFLAAVMLLLSGDARAQEGHKLWGKGNLSPDDVRKALSRLAGGEAGDGNPFQDLFKDYLQKNNPKIDKEQAEKLLKQFANNEQLMDMVKEFAKQKQTDPGRPPKLTQEDLLKLFNTPQNGGKAPELPPEFKNLKGFGDLKPDPNMVPPPIRDPKMPPPMVDPNMVPMPPIRDPKMPPNMGDPFPKQVDPQMPPEAIPPQPGMPPAAKDKQKDTLSLDQNPFPEPEGANDPRTKSLEAFAAVWERSIGPLSETPEVQRALFDLVSGENGFDFDLKDESGNSFWDFLKNGGGSNGSDSFGDIFKDGMGSGSGKWDFGNWEFPKFNGWFGGRSSSSSSNSSSRSSWWNSRSSSSSSSSRSSGSGWGSGGGVGGIGSAWIPFVLLLLVILGVFLWFQLKNLRGREPGPAFVGDGLGPWPVDPRSINTREDVVKAFEYLSVLICGPSARNWTHGTIADALADLARTHEDTAVMLARLYELARYAPLDEPLSRDELIEARRLVCSLAGVSS